MREVIAFVLLILLLYVAIFIFYIVTMWKIFTKAGKPGWAVLIPIYNVIVFFQIAGKPWWWIFLMLVPVLNIVIYIMAVISIARYFNKGIGFSIGLLLLPIFFWPILSFANNTYNKIDSANNETLPS